jgi:hypothetical protein
MRDVLSSKAQVYGLKSAKSAPKKRLDFIVCVSNKIVSPVDSFFGNVKTAEFLRAYCLRSGHHRNNLISVTGAVSRINAIMPTVSLSADQMNLINDNSIIPVQA